MLAESWLLGRNYTLQDVRFASPTVFHGVLEQLKTGSTQDAVLDRAQHQLDYFESRARQLSRKAIEGSLWGAGVGGLMSIFPLAWYFLPQKAWKLSVVVSASFVALGSALGAALMALKR